MRRAVLLLLLLTACGGSGAAPYDPSGVWHGVLRTNGVEDSTFTLELAPSREGGSERGSGVWRFDTNNGEGDVDVVVANTRRVQLRLYSAIGCRAEITIEAIVADEASWSGTMDGETCERRYDGDVAIVRE
ncbi:MAG: hypothetical protein RIT81_27540 [Deltaproteobacteria bacterium]